MTEYEYEVQGYYGKEHGWEAVTTEETREEAEARLREYNENELGTPHRVRRVRREETA